MSYSDDIAVSVEHVSKIYKVFETPMDRFRYHMFGRNKGMDFTALSDVSFQIKKGESFGIIGKNGSGKSTMLQILAGIIKPTSGNIFVNGRVAALLELGSGFNPESTGYENIYMNAAILGIKKEEIESKVQAIIDFAAIGEFISRPVKTYSSGMYVRLAFAVAINVDADVLLIDEALAVGDVFFRQKCYARLNELKAEGKTIILVSHGMNEVEQFCDRVLLLNYSKVLMCGNSKDAVQQYYLLDYTDAENKMESMSENDVQAETGIIKHIGDWSLKEEMFCDIENCSNNGNGYADIINVGIFNKEGYSQYVFEQGDEAYFYIQVLLKNDIECPTFGVAITDQRGIIIHGKDSTQYPNSKDTLYGLRAGTRFAALQKIKLDIAVGEYTFDVGCTSVNKGIFNKRSELNQEQINAGMTRICAMANVGNFSVTEKKEGSPTKVGFHGCCDLSGNIWISTGTKGESDQ